MKTKLARNTPDLARQVPRSRTPASEGTTDLVPALLKVDLITIATHGYAGVKHAFLGSTAEQVVRHEPCPVLIVRRHERQFA